MKKAIIIPLIMILVILLLQDASVADPRSQTVKFTCRNETQHNRTLYVPNWLDVMTNINEQIRVSGFGVAATGSGLDRVYGLAQCYGDLLLVDCVLCFAEGRTAMTQCYPSSGGRIYLDGCFIRSENFNFYDEYTDPADKAVCANGSRLGSAFPAAVRQGLSRVVSAAMSNKGYGRAQVAVTGTANESVYVLAECWRSLSPSSCRACLENASASLLGCVPSSEGRVLNTGCFVRYSDSNFLNPPILGNGNSRGRSTVIVIATVSAATVLMIAAAIGVYRLRNRKIEKKRKGDAEKLVKTLNDSSLNFKYSTLEKATGSFDEANKLGKGGFGTVYKGVLADGREIAIKRLFFNNKLRAADFYNEVNIISSVEHKNLVRLLGCSCLGPESLLVFEFLPNRSLDRFIFDSNKGKTLNWRKRFRIIVGTAEGLVYLHENTKARIIHRDIKASNILLDLRFNAKIADFGLARTFQEDKSHISTAVAGTLGYMAPEYVAFGQLTEKVDVYSFGVLLLEIVTGKQNNRSQISGNIDSLVTLTWKHFQQGRVEELFDPNLMLHDHHNVNVKNEILRVVHVGLLCTQELASFRPSMSEALLMLVSKEHLPAPMRPPFMDAKTMELKNTSRDDMSSAIDYGSAASVATISQSIFYPR